MYPLQHALERALGRTARFGPRKGRALLPAHHKDDLERRRDGGRALLDRVGVRRGGDAVKRCEGSSKGRMRRKLEIERKENRQRRANRCRSTTQR